MKNLKKNLAVLATATLLSFGLGNLTSAMQGIERFNLKSAEEITEQTNFTKPIEETNRHFKEYESDFKDFKTVNLKRTFYGTTANEQLGLSVALYKDLKKELGEDDNYVVSVSFMDSLWYKPENEVKYIAYDGHVVSVGHYEEFVRVLEEIKCPDARDIGDARTFPITVGIVNKEPKDSIDAIYVGVRYKNQETNNMEDLVYVVKLKDDKNISFEGYGNGKIILQDTDGDKIWDLKGGMKWKN